MPVSAYGKVSPACRMNLWIFRVNQTAYQRIYLNSAAITIAGTFEIRRDVWNLSWKARWQFFQGKILQIALSDIRAKLEYATFDFEFIISACWLATRYWHPGTYIVRSVLLMRTLTLVWIQTNNTDTKRLGTIFLKHSLVSCFAVTLNHPIFNYINYNVSPRLFNVANCFN